jgi:hypothetical protein
MKTQPNKFPEDVVFAHHLAHDPLRATWAEADSFSTESRETPNTLGFHDGEKYCPVSNVLYTGFEGPSRRLVKIRNAHVDGKDVTDFVRIGIGPACLRLGHGTLFWLGRRNSS